MVITAISYLITFLFGNFCGYLLRGIIDRTCEDSFSDELVLISVTSMFVLTSLMSLFDPNVNVPTSLYALMGGIVGYLFPKKIKK